MSGSPARWRTFLLLFVVPAAALALAVYLGWWRVPPNLAPWSEIDLEQPPGSFARLQLNSLISSPNACFVVLGKSGLKYRRITNRPLKNGCGLPAGLSVLESNVPYSSGFTASCPLAAGLYWFEQQVQARAREHFGRELARIQHLGTYACRNINSASSGRRSQHATANAIDIAGFRLDDGRLISLSQHWGEESPAGRFLKDVKSDGCGLFNTVLGPDYNPLHRDHFHLDFGRTRICR